MKQSRKDRNSDSRQSLQKEIGSRLVALRLELGLNQVDLANECGVSNVRISENENGHALIGTDLVIALWKTFRVSPFYLLLGIGPRRFRLTVEDPDAGLAVLGRAMDALQQEQEWLLANGGEALPQPKPDDMYRFSNVGKVKREEYTVEEVRDLLNEIRQKKKPVKE